MDASDVNDLLTDFENQTIHNMENMFKENIYIRRVGVYHTGSGIEGLNKLALLHDKKDADNGHQDNTCSRPQPVTAEKAELFSVKLFEPSLSINGVLVIIKLKVIIP